MQTVFVWDIDSTIANNNHRADLLQKQCLVCLSGPIDPRVNAHCNACGSQELRVTQASWDAFLDVGRIAMDQPIPAAIRVLDKLREVGAPIVFITGRNVSKLGEVTKEWLREHAGWREDSETLIMREKDEEGLSASAYKERAVQRLKALHPEFSMYVFFEDDSHVFNVYNKHGLVVRCPEGLQHLVPSGAVGFEAPLSR